MLVALACLCCVTQAAQQIPDVAEVERGIFFVYFVLFFVLKMQTVGSCPPIGQLCQLPYTEVWQANIRVCVFNPRSKCAQLLLLLLLTIETNNNFISLIQASLCSSQPRAINVCLTCAEDAVRKGHSKRQQTVRVSAADLTLQGREQMPRLPCLFIPAIFGLWGVC